MPPPFSAAAPLRLEGPFKGVRLEHADLFLSSLYRPAEVGSFASSPALQRLEVFEGVYDLANQLDCGLLLGALNSRLAASDAELMLHHDLLGWIAFSDRWGVLLMWSPKLRHTCGCDAAAMASRALPAGSA